MLAGFGQIFKGLWNGIKQIFNIKNYIRIFKTYSADFGALGWILSVLAIIVVVAIFAYYFYDSACCEKVHKIQTLYRQQRGSYRRNI